MWVLLDFAPWKSLDGGCGEAGGGFGEHIKLAWGVWTGSHERLKCFRQGRGVVAFVFGVNITSSE